MQEPDESQNVMNIMALQYMQTFLVHFRNPRYDVKIPSSTLFNWHYPLRAHEQALYSKISWTTLAQLLQFTTEYPNPAHLDH
jgi:hypothetical protein